MVWNSDSESYVLFIGDEKLGKSFNAMLPKRQLASMGFDIRFSQALPKVELIFEEAHAKESNPCEPGEWRKMELFRFCGHFWDGAANFEDVKAGESCRVFTPCIKGDFLRVRKNPDWSGDVTGVLVSLVVR